MKTYKFLTWSFVLASLLTSCGSDSGNGGGGTSLPNIEETKKDTATNGSASSDTTSPAAASAAPAATPANIKEAVTAITSATATVAAALKTLVKNTSIKINSGDTLVSTTAVNLTLAAENAAQQYVTNVAGCASGGTWENFNATKLWTLGQTNVTATVYVKFRDNANVESDCVSTTITHDSIAPNGSFDILTFCDSQEGAMRGCDTTARIRTYLYIIGPPDVYKRYDTNTLHVVLSISAPDATQMYVTNTAGCTADGSWETYATTRNWVLTQTNAVNNVYIKFKDVAGNQSSCTTASITHSDTAVPYSGRVRFNSYISSDTTTTTPVLDLWVQAGDGSWVGNETARLNGFLADETFVKITNNNNCSGGSWQSYTSTSFAVIGGLWQKFTAYNVGVGSGTAWVSAQFKDVSGNVSACFSNSITVAP